jgi:hypothetical protein
MENHERSPIDAIPPHKFHLTLRTLLDEFGKTRRSFETRRCASNSDLKHCKMILISERYAVDAKRNPDKSFAFFLIDTLHNEKR